MNFTQLMVFGGGRLPARGLETFAAWSRARAARPVLVIGWASGVAEASATAIVRALNETGPVDAVFSLDPPRTSKAKAEFRKQLDEASGVFFTGGNQNRIADVLEDAAIRDHLRARFLAGVPFAGTSAGTAIMSNRMFAGDTDPGALNHETVRLREGLGLCPGVIFDQHFLKRQRQNRLFAAVLRHPECLGVGIDEDTGLSIVNGRKARVEGPEKVMRIVPAGPRSSLSVDLFHEDEEFDLFSERQSFSPAWAPAASF